MTGVAAIALNTFREAIRNKVLYSLLFFGLAFILSALVLGELTLGQQVRLTRDLGLYGVDIFGVLIAIFLGVSLLYKELQLKTIYTILPKPIHRWQFVAGKWLGMLMTLGLQVLVMGIMVYVALFIQGAEPEMATAKALWLLLINVTVITSVALFFSSFSSPFLSGLFSLGVFIVGRSVPDLRMVGEKTSGVVQTMIEAITYVAPNLHLFLPSGVVIGADHVSVHKELLGYQYMAWTTLYGLGYSVLAVLLAVWIFSRRDFV